MTYRKIIISMLLISCMHALAQSNPDTNLQTKNFKQLQMLFDELPNDSIGNKEEIATVFLAKAKATSDTINSSRAYYLFSVLRNRPKLGKMYADSIINLTKNLEHESFPALGYFLKGYWCYQLSEYQASLKNYLIGDSIAKKRGNVKQYVGNRKMIALLKSRAGDYRGALEIYLTEIDSLNLIKKDNATNSSDYLNRLYNASLVYMHLNNLDSARIYSNRGLNESSISNDTLSYNDFIYNLGVIEFLSGNFELAEKNIDKALLHLDDYSKTMAYYYKGEIAKHHKNEMVAFRFFEISDSISESLKYSFPELRHIYEYKIEHYEKNDDLPNQLVYINKLLSLDSALVHAKDLRIDISNKYDRPILLHKKEAIISNLQNQNKLHYFIIAFLILIVVSSIYGLYIYRQKQKNYSDKYDALVLKNSSLSKTHNEENEQNPDVIPPEINEKIKLGLRNFVNNEEYLRPITLVGLAKKLETNTSYLSKFININTDDNFSQYLNKLRVIYVTEKLKTDTKLRSYTIRAIAKEIGFGTAQSFTKAFYQETGIYPSYYIKKLNTNSVNL